MLPLTSYKSVAHYEAHAKAWRWLEQGIASSLRDPKSTFADRALRLACEKELQALGFKPLVV